MLADDERDEMRTMHHRKADMADGETGWHMFDIPRFMMVSRGKVGERVVAILSSHSHEMTGSFQVGYGNAREEDR